MIDLLQFALAVLSYMNGEMDFRVIMSRAGKNCRLCHSKVSSKLALSWCHTKKTLAVD